MHYILLVRSVVCIAVSHRSHPGIHCNVQRIRQIPQMAQDTAGGSGSFRRIDTFCPPARVPSFDRNALDGLFAQAGRDAFDLPEWIEQEVAHLAEMFAPVITQDVAEDYDRFGVVGWDQGRVTIEQANPMVYFHS